MAPGARAQCLAKHNVAGNQATAQSWVEIRVPTARNYAATPIVRVSSDSELDVAAHSKRDQEEGEQAQLRLSCQPLSKQSKPQSNLATAIRPSSQLSKVWKLSYDYACLNLVCDIQQPQNLTDYGTPAPPSLFTPRSPPTDESYITPVHQPPLCALPSLLRIFTYSHHPMLPPVIQAATVVSLAIILVQAGLRGRTCEYGQ